MKDLLRETLIASGLTREEGDGDRWILEDGRERTIIDLDAMEVTTTRQDEAVVKADVTASGRGYSQSAAREDARLRLEEARAQARAALQAQSKRQQGQLSQELATSDQERQALLHLLLQQVYAESLKRKARQLGDIVDIQEGTSSSGEYELVIKVEA